MNVFITGIGGYLGSQLTHALSAAGHAVTGSSHIPRQAHPAGGPRIAVFGFDSLIPKAAFQGVDIVIHCAHDHCQGRIERNVRGTKAIYYVAKESGVSHHFFISSYSARPDAITEYGKTKHVLESFFLGEGATIVRPGLVIGNGGLFGRALRALLRTPLVPLVDGGLDMVPVVSIADFLRAMSVIVQSRARGAFNLFNEELISVRDLIRCLNAAASHKALLLSLPLNRALAWLEWMRRAGIPFPVDADNLRALKVNQRCLYRSDLAELIGTGTPFEHALRLALADYRRSRKR